MTIRTRTLLILILALPLALLAWLGQRSLAQDRIVAEHQASALAQARLREAQVLVHGFISELEQSAITALSFLDIENTVSQDQMTLIRNVVNTDPFLEQVFVLGSERTLLFPLNTPIHSNAERRFVESLLLVLSDTNAFRAKPIPDVDGEAVDKSAYKIKQDGLFTRQSRQSNISATIAQAANTVAPVMINTDTGWTTWDTGTATDIYLWHRTSNAVLLGQKLSSAYWLSQLIARLPSSGGAEALTQASIRLVDKRQRTIYQWGGYSVNDGAFMTPLSKEWLTYPLDGWRLEYYAPKVSTGHAKALIFLVAFLSLLTVIWLAVRMAWDNYRQEIRIAEQRVSFVNQVSHELKTPLTNICIYADMLEAEVSQERALDPQRVKKFTRVVTSESQRLGRLINNVLNFSRAQQHKISVHKTLTSVDEVIQRTINNFAPAFASKCIKIETQLGASNAVMVDSELLEQVLNNLFSNIEKYAVQGGVARVVSSVSNARTTISVSDAGPGVPAAQRETVFLPFERGSDSLIEGVSGTGIGLSIARNLCRLHGGDLVLVDSEQGACFDVTLQTEAEP